MADSGNLAWVRSALTGLLDEAFLGPTRHLSGSSSSPETEDGFLAVLARTDPDLLSTSPYGASPSVADQVRHLCRSLDRHGSAIPRVWAEPACLATDRSAAAGVASPGALSAHMQQAYLATRERLLAQSWLTEADVQHALATVMHAVYHLGAVRETLLLLDREGKVDTAIHVTDFTPYERALSGLEPWQALKVPPGSPYSVAQVLAHMVFWQDWLVASAAGSPQVFPAHAEEGWPPPTAEGWPNLVQRFLSGLEQARAMARDAATRHRLVFKEDTGARVLADLAVHNAHHLGEIILLRRLNGDWPPPGGGDTW